MFVGKRLFSLTLAAAIFVPTGLAAQQKQMPINKHVLQISPEGSCPSDMERRISPANQQVALSNYGQDIHYCVKIEDEAETQTPLETGKVQPVFIPRRELGTGNSDPSIEQLNPQEFESLSAAISGFEFPTYMYSGCHDRAHAAYLMLPESLRRKAMKVWVVAPAVYAQALQSTIKISKHPNVKWSYHVALAFSTEVGLKLYDPTLSAKKLISEPSWLDTFEYPNLSFRTYTSGGEYLWYTNANRWNGNTYEYNEGPVGETPKDQRWIPNALARDAVGELVESGRSCAGFQQFRQEPGDLLGELQKASDLQISGCAAERSLFNSELERWEERIGI